MKFDVLTIFPEYFDVLNQSLLGKAIDSGKFGVEITNIRDFSRINISKPTIRLTVAVRVWL